MNYPNEDFPFTHYFNGQAMPKWSQCWYATNLIALAKPEMQSWNETINPNSAWLLQCRLDHIGVVESENPLQLRLICITLFEVLVANGTEVERSLMPLANEFGVPANEVMNGIRAGLIEMAQLAARDKIAFWTVGYEEDKLRLDEVIRRHRLPVDHSDHLLSPHMQRQQGELQIHYAIARKRLLSQVHAVGMSKAERQWIFELPKHH